MTTIMITGGAAGDGRCDARCHTAKHRSCACVCRGRYHGTGSSELAQERLTDDLITAGVLNDEQVLAVRHAGALRAESRSPGVGQEALAT